MSWLVLVFALEAGWLPNGAVVMYEVPEVSIFTGSLYTDLSAQLEIAEVLYVGGGTRINVWASEGEYTFWPAAAYFSFEAGARWKGVEIFFRHYCQHPIAPYVPVWDYHGVWEGSYEEVGIRFTGRARLW